MLRRIVPDALAAPLFALLDKGGERVLFVEEDGRAKSRVVQLGIIDGDRIQVVEGLQPGDHLIVTGQTEVEDGMKVVVQ
jgi:membrane fusion protein (multidrug efflux system)